jgi:GT2 family glycosyltransferase/glycosyltransferase involved in cell wall biosynthesis
MKPSRRVKQSLQDQLTLSSKIFLRRLFVGSVRPLVRLAAAAVRSTKRIVERASENGLDLSQVWEVKPKLKTSQVEQWSARDFLFVMNEVSDKQQLTRRTNTSIRISIIIPVFNKVEYTFQCLRSLMREIDFAATEVIVINNASADETSALLSHFAGFVQVIENDENLGFVDACNQGAATARGEHLVFLNNDTVVLPGWLKHLLDSVENHQSVGAVGSMFLYPDGLIQEAGAIVWSNGEAHHYGWGKSVEDKRFNFAREVDYCSAASLLIRKKLFDELGGFDRRYSPAYYEDIDVCFGVRSLGYKVLFQPMSRVIHYEGVTAGRDTAVGIKHYQITNRQKFVEKWRDVLQSDHLEQNLELIEKAANRKHSPHVIVFDDRVPTPDRDAGSARMFNILKSLARISQPVFVSVKPLLEYEKWLWKEGIETANVVEYRRLLKKRNFRAAILSRPDVATALFSKLRRADGKMKIVFDMVDAYFIRLSRESEVTGDQNLQQEAKHFEDLELKLARASDQVWCNSSEDKNVVSREVAEERIVVIPTIHPLQERGRPFEERHGLLFIGHLKHRPNSDAVHYFMREIYPLIERCRPEINFYIVGSGASQEILAYQSETVHVMGYVPDIDPLFQSVRVFVGPLRFGAGTKGKIGDALAYGLPVVTTSIGSEGFALTGGETAMIADEPQTFADSVLQVYREQELWQRLSNAGYSHIQEHFTPEIIGETIEAALARLGVIEQRAQTSHRSST